MSRETVDAVLRYLHARYPHVRRGNPRYNPNTVNIAAINRFNQNTGRMRNAILPSDVEIYHKPESNVRLFHAHFPLGRFFNKVKDGARIFLTTKSTRNNRATQKSPAMDQAVVNLLAAGIIAPSKNGPCISPMFLIRKASGKARPIIDLHHMVKFSDTPKMVLPSIFQLVRRKIWEQGMWYLKLDFKSAFYNIPVHAKSQHLFNFAHQGKFYKFTRLPFGAPISPFFMQRFLNAIIHWIRLSVPYAWGHMDDIIIADQNPHTLATLSKTLQAKLTAVKWILNEEKSQLSPAKSVIFLGAYWRQTGITRLKAISARIHDMI